MKSVFTVLFLSLVLHVAAQPMQVGPSAGIGANSASMEIADDGNIFISYINTNGNLYVKKKDSSAWSLLPGVVALDNDVNAHTLLYNNNLGLLYCIYTKGVTDELYLQIFDGTWYGLTSVTLSENPNGLVAVVDETNNTLYIAIEQHSGLFFYKYNSVSSSFESMTGPLTAPDLWNSDLYYSSVDGFLYCSVRTSSGATLYRYNNIAWTTVTTNFANSSSPNILRSYIDLNENSNNIAVAYSYSVTGGSYAGVKRYNCGGPGSGVVVPEAFYAGASVDVFGCSVNPTNDFVVYAATVNGITNFYFCHSGTVYEHNLSSGNGIYDNLIHDTNGNLYWTVISSSDPSSPLKVFTFANYNAGISGSDIDRAEIFPNPASQKVYINGSEVYTYRLFDLSGKLVQKGNNFSKTNPIPLESLEPAPYVLLLIDKNNDYSVHKLIVR